jgi:hypothetical protein
MTAAASAGTPVPNRKEARRNLMNNNSCLVKRLSGMGIGALLLLAGLVFAVTASLVMPFIGIVAAAPLLIAAAFLVGRARMAKCTL